MRWRLDSRVQGIGCLALATGDCSCGPQLRARSPPPTRPRGVGIWYKDLYTSWRSPAPRPTPGVDRQPMTFLTAAAGAPELLRIRRTSRRCRRCPDGAGRGAYQRERSAKAATSQGTCGRGRTRITQRPVLRNCCKVGAMCPGVLSVTISAARLLGNEEPSLPSQFPPSLPATVRRVPAARLARWKGSAQQPSGGAGKVAQEKLV